MPRSPSRLRRWVAVTLVLAALFTAFYLGRRPLLTQIGGLLVFSSPLERADAAVVLSGDDSYEGYRVRAAIRLYQQGWVRKLVLSGAKRGYGIYESELSAPLAVSEGVPRADILAVPHATRSTKEEAQLLCPLMERKGIRSFYVVTSNFHTRRAHRIFLHASGGRMRVLAYPADDDWFKLDRWWQSREGRKIFLLESLKTINSTLE